MGFLRIGWLVLGIAKEKFAVSIVIIDIIDYVADDENIAKESRFQPH